MTALDRLLPLPRLLELDHVDLAAPPEQVWKQLRHGELAQSPLVRALFAVRTLPDRVAGRKPPPGRLRLDDIVSSEEQPGFQILVDDPPREVVVAAIGKVWQLDIPFVHLPDVDAYARFAEPGFVKVAWALRVLPHGRQDTRVEIEVRVDATDEESWQAFRRYFRMIGPGSHFIRRSLLAALARELGTPEAQEDRRPLPGDELMPSPAAQFTHGVTIAAPPERIWPWLLQMGCRRAGYYSVDTLDNGGKRSARELHPELADVHVGQILPATPGGEDGFEVLRIEAPHTLVLGGLWDVRAHRQLPFASPRPARFSQVTWAFALEPLDPGTTRLHVRARGDFSADGRWHAIWIRPVHHLMQTTQLQNLAARAEGRLPADDWRDVLTGLSGAALIAFNFLTPFRRHQRSHWGLDQTAAARAHPGDQLIPNPRWGWTHAVEIDAPASAVWGWVAQIGADRGGFYSYQWLENVAGCGLHNAERVHPEWEVHPGHRLLLHPKMPPLSVVDVCPGRYFVAYGEPDPVAVDTGEPWLAASWLFHLEPLGEHRCRLVSRFRSDYSNQLATRLANSPALVEPVGFAMDRRMLLGIKERAEAAWAQRRHDRNPAGAAPPAA